MSAVRDTIGAIRDALRLAEDVKRTSENLKILALEVRDHEKRLIRLEAKWETAIELASTSSQRF